MLPRPLRRTLGKLSVVVPIHNVEPYLADCLDSILAQSYRDLEVILVDDGSTDGSPDIARRYAGWRRTWRFIQTENRGLGAARNRGVAEATGDYLAFVDSDDLVPTDAYSAMVSTLADSGSDFVVGSVQQLVDGELVEPEFIRRGVERRRIGVTAADAPWILRNVFAWNKVFRRSFYEGAGIRFPEGVRYEDQPAMLRAYLTADRFDIIRRPVYTWRVRTDGSSITQRRADLSDLEDRLTTKQLTSVVVRTYGDETVLDFWGRLALVGDLPVYFDQIPGADDSYWQRLVTGLRELLEGFPPIESSMLRLPQRLVGWLVTADRRADAERVLAWIDAHPGPLSLRVDGDRAVPTELPFVSDTGADLPKDLRSLGEHELDFDARLLEAHWEDTTLVVTGWALIRGAPTSGVSTAIRASLRDDAGDDIVGLNADVTRFAAPAATTWVARGDQTYDDSGFVARFDLADWVSGRVGQPAELTVRIEVDVAGIHRAGPVQSTSSDLDPKHLPDASFARLTWRPGDGLVVVRS